MLFLAYVSSGRNIRTDFYIYTPSVMVLTSRRKKFFLLYEGPYEIVEIKMDNAYVLKDPQTHEVIGTQNATNLKRYYLH